MMRQVRGLGTLVRADGSTKLVARVTLPASMVVDVKPGQDALVETQEGPFAKGHVSSISPSASGDTRIVNVVLDAVSEGTSAGLKVDRKSTRLNSSHPSISYAVFCLKKKTGNHLVR